MSAAPSIAELLIDLILAVQRGSPYGSERAAVLAHVAGLERDAKRYRRLCESGLPLCFEGNEYASKRNFDEAIDAAMREQP